MLNDWAREGLSKFSVFRDSYVEWSCAEQTGLLSWMSEKHGGWLVPIFALAHEQPPRS